MIATPKIIRSVLEKYLKYFTFRKTLPGRFPGNRVIYVSPGAQLKYLKFGESSFDKVLLDIAEHFIDSNSVVWDVGANVGVFSLASAALGAQVVAMEPDPFLLALLNKSKGSQRNAGLNISILPIALGKDNSIERLQIANRGRASNALETSIGMKSQMGGVIETIDVPVMTLDTLLTSKLLPPTFLKIDVEGSEVDVLMGARKILSEIRPTIFIEADVVTRPQVEEILRQYEYDFFESISEIKCGSGNVNTITKKDTIAIPRFQSDLI